jgi:putative oxidoreductase
MSIPVAIVSAAFVTVVEVVGSVLVLAGALITVVAACYLIVMVGAAVFVHIPHGIFAVDGGWELVGAIAALLLVLAATGPGRWSVDHAILTRQGSVSALQPLPSAPTSAPPPRLPASSYGSPPSVPTVAHVPAPAPSTDPLAFLGRRLPTAECVPEGIDTACP